MRVEREIRRILKREMKLRVHLAHFDRNPENGAWYVSRLAVRTSKAGFGVLLEPVYRASLMGDPALRKIDALLATLPDPARMPGFALLFPRLASSAFLSIRPIASLHYRAADLAD